MFRRAVILVAIVLVAMAALAPAAFGESAIRVWKWNDLNANGIWEGEGTGEGEPGLLGWVMTFYSRASADDPWVQVAQGTTGRLINIGGSGPAYLPGFTWLSVPSGLDYRIVESPPIGEEDLWVQSFPGYGPTGSVPTIFWAVADGETYTARFGDYLPPPDGPKILSLKSSAVPNENGWSNDPRITFSWTVAEPATVAGYSYELGYAPGMPDTVLDTTDATVEVDASWSVSSDFCYFSVRACGTDGTWGPPLSVMVLNDAVPLHSRWFHLEPEAPLSRAFGVDVTGSVFWDGRWGSEVWYTEWSYDEGPWVVEPNYGPLEFLSAVVPAPADHSNDGHHVMRCRGWDRAGNSTTPSPLEFDIDTRPPALALSGADGAWHPLSAFVVSASDPTGLTALSASCLQLGWQYSGKWDAGWGPTSECPPSESVSLPSEYFPDGIYPLSCSAADGTRPPNATSPKSAQIKVDSTAPVTTATGLRDNATSGWQNSSQTVTLLAIDPLSGVAATTYSLDGVTGLFSAPFIVSGDGSHALTYSSTDVAGNIEAVKIASVKIDTTSPQTTASGTDDVWHTASVTLTFSASDPKPTVTEPVVADSSGLDYIEYKVGRAGTWTRAAAVTIDPPVTARTRTNVSYRAVDLAGNVEPEKSCEVKFDTTSAAPPADTTAPITTVLGVDSEWYAVPVSLSFTAQDLGFAASGVAYTEYKLDDGPWTQGTSVTVPAPPRTTMIHTLLYRSMDNAGNQEVAKSCQVRINTKPAPPLEPPSTTAAGYDEAWHGSPVTITLTAIPSLGGLPVAYSEYRLGEGAWTRGTTAVVPASADHSSDGIQTVGYRSADIAVPANVEGVKTCKVKIDTTGPTTKALANVTVKKGKKVTFRYLVNDALPSGLALSPTATITIVVQNARFKTVKRLALGIQPTNIPLSCMWTCGLKKGGYRFLIYATDEAGNAQAKVGSGKLVVK